MNRPLSDKRPVGPIFESGGECKLRAKFMFSTKAGVIEAKQSFRANVEEELNRVLSFSNLTIMSGEFGEIEIAFDVDSRTFSSEDEDQVERGLGRAIMDAGADNVRAEDYVYTVVSR